MTSVNRTLTGSKGGGGEITFADAVRFLRRNWKLLGLLTLLLSVISVGLVLLSPREYQKEITLVVSPAPTELYSLVDIAQLGTPEEIQTPAVNSLQGQNFGGVEVNSTYDVPSGEIRLLLRSRDADAMAEASPEIVSALEAALEERYERYFDNALNKMITAEEREVETLNAALNRVEERSGGGSSDSEAEEEQRVVELERVFLLAQTDVAEAGLEDLRQAREDLPRLNAETVFVPVLSESDVQQNRTTGALVPLAIGVSFAAAVVLALAREAFAGRKQG